MNIDLDLGIQACIRLFQMKQNRTVRRIINVAPRLYLAFRVEQLYALSRVSMRNRIVLSFLIVTHIVARRGRRWWAIGECVWVSHVYPFVFSYMRSWSGQALQQNRLKTNSSADTGTNVESQKHLSFLS